MKVFVTGATGVLGRPTTRMLEDAAHEVRTFERRSMSLFDSASMRTAIDGCDAILHLATRIPPPAKMTQPGAWKDNDRIRSEGTHNLVELALEIGVSTFIYPSIVFFYPDRGAEWQDASTATVQPTPILQSSLTAEAEVARFTRSGKRGIVLRMGGFYGPTAGNTAAMLRIARRYRIAMTFGRADAYIPLIWVDDAALAVVDALGKANAGIYDIVDDEPLQRRELASALAQAAGRKWLLRPPTFLLRLLQGKAFMSFARSQRVSNRRFKEATGWEPTVASARIGFPLSAVQP